MVGELDVVTAFFDKRFTRRLIIVAIPQDLRHRPCSDSGHNHRTTRGHRNSSVSVPLRVVDWGHPFRVVSWASWPKNRLPCAADKLDRRSRGWLPNTSLMTMYFPRGNKKCRAALQQRKGRGKIERLTPNKCTKTKQRLRFP